MIERTEILSMPEYWFQDAQLDLYNQVRGYMKKEKINNVQLADKLGVHRSYVTQILNGEYNYSLRKLIEICLSIGIVPKINYTALEDVIKADAEKKTNFSYQEFSSLKGNLTLVHSSLEPSYFDEYKPSNDISIKDVLLHQQSNQIAL